MNHRIHSLRVQNVLAVENVELEPAESGLTIIAGRNGQGKSSLLRAIELLLEYRAASQKIANPLRNGQTKGTVELDLGDGLVVRRTITEKGTTLTVKRGDDTIGSPQSFLDTIRPPDLLDPLAFSAMPPAERRRLMIQVAGLGDKLVAAEADIAQAEERRLEAGREARSAKAVYDELPDAPPETPDERVSASALLTELQELQRQFQERRDAQTEVMNKASQLHAAEDRVEELKAQLAEAKKELIVERNHHEIAKKVLDRLPEPSEARGAALQEAIAAADETNFAVERKLAKVAAKNRMRVTRDVHEAAENTVESARAARDVLIDKAELPLPDLGFDAEDATFNGVRWASLGTAEQLRIGLALGAEQHPGLPVFVIHRGESLDADALAAVDAWAKENNVQVLIEVVGGEGHEGAFVIEAGRLK